MRAPATGLPRCYDGIPMEVSTFSMAQRKAFGLATMDSITHVTTNAGLDDVLAYARTKKRIGVDSETGYIENPDDALDPWKGSIELMQFGDSERQFIVWARYITDWTPIEQLLADPTIIKLGQNLKFDITFWLVHRGIEKRWWNVVDAGIIEQVLGCGLFSEDDDKVGMTLKMTSMEAMARRWLGLQLRKDEELRTGWQNVSPETISQEKLLYAADDVCVPDLLIRKQRPWLIRLGLVETINLEHAAIPCFADIEARGMRMDMPQWDRLAETALTHMREAAQALDVLFKVTTTVEILEDGTATYSRDKNYGSKDQLKDLLREYMAEHHNITLIACNKHFKEALIANGFNPERAEKLFVTSKVPNEKNPKRNKIVGGPYMSDHCEALWEDYARYLPTRRVLLPSTESKVLKLNKIIHATFEPDPSLPNTFGIPGAVIDPILTLRKYSKASGTYGYNWHRLINTKTGRLHYQVIQAALTTGRTSTWPNFQNLPSGKEYRSCFIPAETKKFAIADWDQIEPRIIGHISDCFAYKRVFFSKHPDRPEFTVYCQGVTEALDLYTEIGKIMGVIPEWMTVLETKGDDERGISPTKEGKKGRKQSKIVVLGLGYGTGKDKFYLTLIVDLGEAVDKQYSDGLHDAFWAAVPEVRKTLDGLSDIAYPGDDVYRGKKLIRRKSQRRIWHPFVRGDVTWSESLGGRKRFYRATSKGWWTTGRNHPIQSTGADILKRTIVKMSHWCWQHLPPLSGIVNQVHDELIVEVEDELAEITKAQLQQLMREVGETYCPSVPITAAGMIATEWKKD